MKIDIVVFARTTTPYSLILTAVKDKDNNVDIMDNNKDV